MEHEGRPRRDPIACVGLYVAIQSSRPELPLSDSAQHSTADSGSASSARVRGVAWVPEVQAGGGLKLELLGEGRCCGAARWTPPPELSLDDWEGEPVEIKLDSRCTLPSKGLQGMAVCSSCHELPTQVFK